MTKASHPRPPGTAGRTIRPDDRGVRRPDRRSGPDGAGPPTGDLRAQPGRHPRFRGGPAQQFHLTDIRDQLTEQIRRSTVGIPQRTKGTLVADQLSINDEILDYIRSVSLREDEVLRGLREETHQLPGGRAMQVLAEEGQFLALLTALIGADKILEIGTFTGYSTLAMARALPPGGRLVTLDINYRWPEIGAGYWKRAEVDDRIEVRIAPASSTLGDLLAENGPGYFDLVFIDADKARYCDYYEAALNLVRTGGLIIVDNTLFFGQVTDPKMIDPDTLGIRALNALLRDDDRVDISFLTVADGVTLARKK